MITYIHSKWIILDDKTKDIFKLIWYLIGTYLFFVLTANHYGIGVTKI